MGKKLKDANSTLKVFGVGEISGIISNEQYDRLVEINPVYADFFEDSKDPEPMFVQPKKEVKEQKTKPTKNESII